jgi:PAS domain S-box-containing protein
MDSSSQIRLSTPTRAGRPAGVAGRGEGWSGLFWSAFRQSRTAMALVDAQRLVLEVNGSFVALLGYRRDEVIGRPVWDIIVGGPLMSPAEWKAAMMAGGLTGKAALRHADGTEVAVQWAGSTEIVTGRYHVLFVALSTSRWGPRFRREPPSDSPASTLTDREREVVSLVALGSTGREIADELHISHDTVRSHVRNAMTKLGARSRAHLVAKALSAGLISA